MMFRRPSISPSRLTQQHQQQTDVEGGGGSRSSSQRNGSSSSSLQDKTSFSHISFVFLCCVAAYSLIHKPALSTNLEERRTANHQPFTTTSDNNNENFLGEVPLNDNGETMTPRELRRWERQQNIKRREEKKKLREAAAADQPEREEKGTMSPREERQWQRQENQKRKEVRKLKKEQEQEGAAKKSAEGEQDDAAAEKGEKARKIDNEANSIEATTPDLEESASKTLPEREDVGVSVTSDATPSVVPTKTTITTTSPPLLPVTRTTTSTTRKMAPLLPPTTSVGNRIPQLPVNATFNQKHNLLDSTRICRLENPTPTFKGEPLDLSESIFRGMGLNFRYQCDGPIYNNFTDNGLLPLIGRKQRASATFGTRPTIVPLKNSKLDGTTMDTHDNNNNNNNNNKSINLLVLGNSHMRQIIITLMCQYREQHLETRHYAPPDVEELLETVNRQYIFALSPHANLTLTVFTNHPVFYSTRWQENIEEFLGHPLQDLDAIVMGQFNPFKQEYVNTALWQGMIRYSRLLPSHQVDIFKNRRALTVEEMLEAYDGPIVYMSSMAVYNTRQYFQKSKAMHRITKKTGRTNCQYINARDHLATPEINGYECTNKDSAIVGDCDNGRGSHRCAGTKGGEPDIVAHELVQKLWNIFG